MKLSTEVAPLYLSPGLSIHSTLFIVSGKSDFTWSIEETLPLIRNCTSSPELVTIPSASFTFIEGIIRLRSICMPFFELATALSDG